MEYYLKSEVDELLSRFEGEVCPECGGNGRKVYASTSTFMGGIGGAAMTDDWCDKCWGTGRSDRAGPNLKEMALKTADARRSTRKQFVQLTKERDKAKADLAEALGKRGSDEGTD
jgi:DnaJ-class molecular chaperone